MWPPLVSPEHTSEFVLGNDSPSIQSTLPLEGGPSEGREGKAHQAGPRQQ